MKLASDTRSLNRTLAGHVWLEAFGIAPSPVPRVQEWRHHCGNAGGMVLSLLQPQGLKPEIQLEEKKMPELETVVAIARPFTDEPIAACPAPSPWSSTLAVRDLIEVEGVYYRVHAYGGGLVAVTAHVTANVLVDKGAMVKNHAIVTGGIRLFGHSVIEGDAIVVGSCTLREDSSVGGSAIVRGNVSLMHHARIDGDAHVSGGVQLQHFAHISRGTLSGGMTVV